MVALSQTMQDELISRHPDVFRKSFAGGARVLVALAVIVYFAFAWWLFSIGSVFTNARWDIAGTYLADWISYESRPDIEFDGNALDIRFPRFDPVRDGDTPAWLVKDTADGTGTSRIVIDMSGAGTVDIVPGTVTVTRGTDTVVLTIAGDRVDAAAPLPAWAQQRRPGDKVIASFGFPGRVEIESDEIKVRHRFLGWSNFLFDQNSPFTGKSLSEVWSLIADGERLDPARSNLALAWNNILYNAEWQHLDVWTKLLQTIVMAFVGTLFASLLAFPLAFAAARNITRSRIANQTTKRLFDFLRAVDMLIWALFFTRAFGPGPLAGISAIFFTDTGTLGKLYSEALENIDDKQREGVRSVGAPPAAVQRFGVLPQVVPVFLAQSLYFWESNTRSATIIGAVGAGGIGLKLWEAMRTNSDWENVAYMVLLILMVVFVFDALSNALRSRLISSQSDAKSS